MVDLVTAKEWSRVCMSNVSNLAAITGIHVLWMPKGHHDQAFSRATNALLGIFPDPIFWGVHGTSAVSNVQNVDVVIMLTISAT